MNRRRTEQIGLFALSIGSVLHAAPSSWSHVHIPGIGSLLRIFNHSTREYVFMKHTNMPVFIDIYLVLWLPLCRSLSLSFSFDFR